MNFKNNEALWALIDQAVVSGGNFLTSLVLVRSLDKSDYGTYSLILLVLLSLNTLHSSLVLYPLTLAVATSDERAGREALGRCIAHTGVLWFVWMIVLAIVMFSLHHIEGFIAVSMAMLTWQMQEVARRALLANAKARHAIVPDLLSYVGQAFVLLALRPQTLTGIFFCIAATSALAMAWQVWITRPLFHELTARDHAEKAWSLGKFTLVANTLNMGILQLPSWTLDHFQGRAAVGSYQALANLVGIANPIVFSMSNMLIPAVARAASSGLPYVRRIMIKNGLLFGALLLPCFVLLGFFPRNIMALAYGSHSPYLPLAPLLQIFTLTFLLQFLATLVGAYEGGLSRPRTYMYAQTVSLSVLATVGIMMMRTNGITGAVYAGVVAAGARMVAFMLLSRRADRAHSTAPVLQ